MDSSNTHADILPSSAVMRHAGMEGFLSTCANIVGGEHVLTEADDKRPFDCLPSGEIGQCAAVVQPATLEELRGVLACAMESGVGVIAQGANTGLVGAQANGTPTQVILSLMRFPPTVQLLPNDRAVVVSASVRLSRLNEAVGQAGYHFPVSLAADPTVGGLIATNAGGSSVMRFGDVRANVLGLEVALAIPGVPVFSRLGALRKNNDGLDLKQLFIGTGGSLGIITRATLSLEPKPTQECLVLAAIDADVFDLADFLSRLEHTFRWNLVSCEGMSVDAMHAGAQLLERLRPSARNRANYCLLLQFASLWDTPRLEEQVVEHLMPSLQLAGMCDIALAGDSEAWRLREKLGIASVSDGFIAMDVSVPRNALLRCRRALRGAVHLLDPEYSCFDFGHIGDGGLHLLVSSPDGFHGRNLIKGQRVKRAVYDCVVHQFGGSFTAEHGIGPSNLPLRGRYRAAEVEQLARRIGSLLDPSAIMGRSSP